MPNPTLTDLVVAQASHWSSLATVAENWIVIRDSERRSHIIPLSHLSSMRRIRTTCPALIVIASGLLVIAAAAGYSKEGNGAAVPFGLLAVIFAVGYFLSRRASVAFFTGSSSTETCSGSFSEAAALIEKVRAAQDLSNELCA
jgi:hypothetical protein